MNKPAKTEKTEQPKTQEGRKVPDGNKAVFDAILKRACPPASEPEDETSERASSGGCA